MCGGRRHGLVRIRATVRCCSVVEWNLFRSNWWKRNKFHSTTGRPTASTLARDFTGATTHIELTNLTKRYRSIAALSDVSATIAPGQIVAVVGANGAGKTTLLRCLAGVAAPTRGEVRYDGQVFHREQIDVRKKFAFLPDVPVIYPEMTVLQHMAMVLRLYETKRQGLAAMVLELLRDLDLVPLAESRLKRLSRGQTYKAALAAVIAVDPDVWMFDEQFASGIDQSGLSVFRRRARHAAARGRTILYTTQLLELAEQFADRVMVLHQGELRVFDDIEALRRRDGGKSGVLERVFSELRQETR